MSITSFNTGPVGERKPELSTTQLVSAEASGSILGLNVSFEDEEGG
jgi:hypothetical protein